MKPKPRPSKPKRATRKAPARRRNAAFSLFIARREKEAIAAFGALIREYPGDGELYEKRALCRGKVGQHAGGVRDLEKALELASGDEQRKRVTESLTNARAEAALHVGKKVKPYRTALYDACDAGDVVAVRKLLDEGADIELGASSRTSNESPLAIACKNGHLEVATLLLDRGADIEAKADTNRWDGPRYWTPLSFAAYEGHEAIVRLLAERGADLRYTDEVGCNAIHLCLIKAHDDRPMWDAAKLLVAFLQSVGVPVCNESSVFLEEIRAGEEREEIVRENKAKRAERNAGREYFVFIPGVEGSWFNVGDLPKGPASYEYGESISLKDRFPKDAAVRFGTHALKKRKPNFAKELRAGLIVLDSAHCHVSRAHRLEAHAKSSRSGGADARRVSPGARRGARRQDDRRRLLHREPRPYAGRD